jgi:DNA-binding NtrC family response regulator
VILSNGEELTLQHLPHEIVGTKGMQEMQAIDPWEQWLEARPQGLVSLEEIHDRIERYFVRWALEVAKHNRTRAAEMLGFAKVDQLRYLMRKHGIE